MEVLNNIQLNCTKCSQWSIGDESLQSWSEVHTPRLLLVLFQCRLDAGACRFQHPRKADNSHMHFALAHSPTCAYFHWVASWGFQFSAHSPEKTILHILVYNGRWTVIKIPAENNLVLNEHYASTERVVLLLTGNSSPWCWAFNRAISSSNSWTWAIWCSGFLQLRSITS